MNICALCMRLLIVQTGKNNLSGRMYAATIEWHPPVSISADWSYVHECEWTQEKIYWLPFSKRVEMTSCVAYALRAICTALQELMKPKNSSFTASHAAARLPASKCRRHRPILPHSPQRRQQCSCLLRKQQVRPHKGSGI